MRKILALVLACGVSSAGGVSGCGKYSAPIPPEMLAPRNVEDLTVQADPQGVVFNWTTPDRDRRGKELKYLDGYRVDRANVSEGFVGTTPGELEWEEVGFVKDTHIEVRERLREEARAQGKVGRRVDAPEDIKKFTFRDNSVQPGRVYLYRIMPINQGGVEGISRSVIRVRFRGTTSDIVTVAREKVEGVTGEETVGFVADWDKK